MDWLRINKNLPQHPKAKALARMLDEQSSWWRIAQVWMWCTEYARDGHIKTVSPELDIEDAASWGGVRGTFVNACVTVGFLVRNDDGTFSVHDWNDHNGAALSKSSSDAERMRKYRETRKMNANANVTRTLPNANANVPGTRRDVTRRDVTKEEKPLSADADDARAVAPAHVPQKPDDDAAVYARWRDLWAPRANAMLDPKRRKIIAARRKERPPERAQQDLLDSLEGWRHDPWEGRKGQTALEILLRDAGQVDKGLALLAAGPPRPVPVKGGFVPYDETTHYPVELPPEEAAQ